MPETTHRVRARRRPTALSTATFEFSSNDATASFECALDDPLALGLVRHAVPGRGPAARRARAARPRRERGRQRRRDAGASTRGRSRRPTRRSSPARRASTVSTTANFTFSSNDPLATFECSLDGESFGSCATPHLRGEPPAPASTSCSCARRTTPAPSTRRPASYSWTVRPLPDTAIINRAGRPDRQPQRDVHVRLQPAGRHVRVRARRGGRRAELLAVHLAGRPTQPDLRRARLRRPRRGRRRQRRPDAGRVELGRRGPRAARRRSPPARTPRPRAGPRRSTSPPTAATSSTSALDSTAGRTFSLCVSPKTYNGVPIGPHEFRGARARARRGAPSRRRRSTRGRSSRRRRPRRRSSSARPTRATRPIRRAAARSRPSPSRATRRRRRSSARSTARRSPTCPDPSEFTGLTPGPHILRVRAVDLALNVDPTPASWTLDGRARLDAAGHDDQHRRAVIASRARLRRDLLLHRQRARLDVRVLDRRAAVRAVRVADGVQPT